MEAAIKTDIAEDIVHLLAPAAARPLLPVIAPVIAAAGYRLVRLRITGEGGNAILQVMAETPAGTMTIDDCVAVNNALSPLLDVEDPMGGAYRLEVSSAGINRPLTRRADFDLWRGHTAALTAAEPIDGQRRFRGRLEGLHADAVRLAPDDDTFLNFPLPQIAEIHLVGETPPQPRKTAS